MTGSKPKLVLRRWRETPEMEKTIGQGHLAAINLRRRKAGIEGRGRRPAVGERGLAGAV